MKNLIEPHNTFKFIRKHHIVCKKKFGQNFLIDKDVLRSIIEGAALKEEDTVLEIGAGIGTLTQFLCQNCKRVVSVEIDSDLIHLLRENLDEFNNYEILKADFLKLDLHGLFDFNSIKSFKICANLPYYITTPVLMKIFKEHVPAESVTLTVQKEVARRMIAAPGEKDYGALTLAVKYYADARILANVSRNSFIPKPKVDSAVVSLDMLKKPAAYVLDEDAFFKFIKAVFSKRRKTFVNSLKDFMFCGEHIGNIDSRTIRDALLSLDLHENIRGERLSLDQFAALFNMLHDSSQRR